MAQSISPHARAHQLLNFLGLGLPLLPLPAVAALKLFALSFFCNDFSALLILLFACIFKLLVRRIYRFCCREYTSLHTLCKSSK